MPSINILNNCLFDVSNIETLYVGSKLTNGNQLVYPIEYQTISGSSDSIIAIEAWDYINNVITIGGQDLQLNQIVNLGDNIRFSEDLIINQNGKNYQKNLVFTIPKLTTFLINQIKDFVISNSGVVGLAPTLALLTDGNGNNLICGQDRPLFLSSQDINIGETNQLTLTYVSSSQSRARAFQIK